MRKYILLAWLAVGSLSSVQAIPVVSNVAGGFPGSETPSGTAGWSFSTTNSLQVNALGIFDEGSNGLVSSHQVGLWDSIGTLLASTTVNPGDTVIGTFIYHSIAPLVLAPGTYSVGAFYVSGDGDVYRGLANSQTFIPQVTYLGGRDGGFSTAFVFPTAPIGGTGLMGPNLDVTVLSAAPELDEGRGFIPLLIGGVLLSLTSGRRRKNNTPAAAQR